MDLLQMYCGKNLSLAISGWLFQKYIFLSLVLRAINKIDHKTYEKFIYVDPTSR